MINIISSSRYKIDRKLIKKAVLDILSKYGFPTSALVNIIFVGKKKMKTISAKYKAEDVALPVLSFTYDDDEKKEDKPIGEIFICYPQAVLLAAEKQKKVDRIILDLVKHGIDNILK